MAKRNSLAKNTLLYIIGNFGSKILNFILVPLYTYYISTGDMGTYDIYYTTATVLVPLVTVSISEASYRWLVDDKSDMGDVLTVTTRILLLGLGCFSVIYGCVFLIFRFEYAIYLYMIVLLSSFYGTFLNVIRGLKKNTLYAALGVVQTFLILVFNILLLVVLKLGVYGLLGAQVISYLILSVLICVLLRKYLKGRLKLKSVDTNIQNEMLRYSWPLIPNSINWWITNLSDRYMIRWMLGASKNGIYSISCKFPGIIDSFISLFSMAWQEDAICSYEDGIDEKYYSKTFEKYYEFLLTTIACAVPVTYYYITLFMESEYQSAWKYTPILYIGTVFHALANYLSVGYNINKDTKWVTITSLVAAATNIIVNLLFMKQFGLQIASISTMLSYFAVFIMRYITTRKIFCLDIHYLKMCSLLLYTALISASVFLEKDIVNLIIFIISVVVFLFVNREFIQNMLRKIVGRR